MSDSTTVQYEIALEIQNSDRVQQVISSVDKSLSDVSKAAKSMDFSRAADSISAMEAEMQKLYAEEGDVTDQITQFERASSKAYKALDEAAVKLNHSLSDAGKQQRARLEELQAEKAALGNTQEERAKAREIEREIKELRKQVVEGTDEEIQEQLRLNTTARARLKIMQNEAKQQKQGNKQQKTLTQLLKADLAPLRDKLKEMQDWVKSLKSVEGRYAAIKKAAKGAVTVGKGIAKGLGGAIGAAAAIGGAAIASADNIVSKEAEAARVKVGNTDEERMRVMSAVYSNTPQASYEQVVDSINRVHDLLGDLPMDDLIKAATAETKMQGTIAMLQQQNVGTITPDDIVMYANKMSAMQSATGASKADIAEAIEYVRNQREGDFGNASYAEMTGLYLALKKSNAFDTDEELQRAYKSFVNQQKTSNVDLFEMAQEWTTKQKWDDRQWKNTDRTQVNNVMKNIDWARISAAAQYENTEIQMTAAEAAAQKVREMSEMKDELMMQVLEAVKMILDGLDMTQLKGIFQAIVDLVKVLLPPVIEIINTLLPPILDVVKALFEFIKPILKAIEPLLTKLADIVGKILGSIGEVISKLGRLIERWLSGDSGKDTTEGNPTVITSRGASGQSRANGGIATMPSIFGEGAYPEMAIPLDPSRVGRSNQLVQNLVQNFSMSGNETTTMSLASALRSRDFAYESGRISTVNRRLGRG